MKIAILSSDSKIYSTKRLKEAAQARGHSVRVIRPAKLALHVDQGKPELYLGEKAVPRFDAIIPRIATSQTFFGAAVVRQFEQMGVFALNSSYSILISRDKLRTMQILSRHKIGLPTSACVLNPEDVHHAITRIGSAPVIIKLLQGSQGAGVMLADSNTVAEAIVEALNTAHQNVLIQKFISESRGRDIRAFVVGDRVVGAMRRIAKGEEFRSNVHLGAETEAVKLDKVFEKTAIRAAHILGLRVAGVDLLESNDGPQVMEVNSSPGLEGIEGATKVDIASAIIEYLEEQVAFPDIDLRERLSLSRGYQIAEVLVSRTSELANQTLAELNLHDREIRVLSILRNDLTIPNPDAKQKVLPGDTLLCFGKQLSLRSLIPTPAAPKKVAKKKKSK